MARIPSIIRTFGAYYQERRKAQLEAKRRKKEKRALEKQQRKAQESQSPNSIAVNAKIRSNGHDIVMSNLISSTNNTAGVRKKEKKPKVKIHKEKSPKHICRSVHMIYTPMGNKR